MDAAAMEHMASNFVKLDKFKGVDFRRWQKKIHFLISSMSVLYVLTTPIPDDGDDATDSLEAKYMAKDASSKKFLVSNFTNYKMTDSRPVMEQYKELLSILGRFTQHKMNMDEPIQVSCIIDKLSPSWKDFKHTLKHLKEELTLVELGSHLHIEESLKMQDNDKPKGVWETWTFEKDCKGGKVSNKANGSGTNGLVDGSTNSLKGHNMFNKSVQVYYVTYVSEAYFVQDDDVVWRVASGSTVHVCKDRCWVPNKRNKITPYELWTKRKPNLNYLRVWGCRAVVRLPDPKLKTLGERGIKCIFVGYADYLKVFRFYDIEPNDSVAISSIIESKDAIFDENRFSSVFRPSLGIPKGNEDIGGSVVPKVVTDEVLDDLPPGCKPLDFKWIFKRKLKVDGIENFKARLVIQGFKQKSGIYYFDTYAPVMDVKTAFLNGALDEEHALEQWHQKFDEVVLSNGYLLNPADCVYRKFDETGKRIIICLYVDDMLIFGTDQVQVNLEKEFLSSRFSMNDMGEANVILGIRIKHKSNGIAISQSHYIEKVLNKFSYFDCTPVSTPMDTSILVTLVLSTGKQFSRQDEPGPSLANLVLPFLKDMNPFGKQLKLNKDEISTKHDHILGLLQKCYQHAHAMSSQQSRETSNWAAEFLNAISYSVTDLTLAGVKFRHNTNEEWLLDMEFKSSRILFISVGYRQVKVLEFFDCLGPRQGAEDLRELLQKQMVKRMASINTRLNIEKLDGNIIQKHGGSKQVGFKQLDPGVETQVHRVHDETRVWFEVELQGAQGDREAEVFQVSNDDTAVAQRRLKEKQPEEKTNTDCLVKEQEKEYQTGWKIKMGNVLDSCNQKSIQQCMKSGVAKYLGVARIQQQNGLAEDTTMSTYLVNRSSSSAIGFKTPIDMLGFFGWLASIKQRMLELVKVKCIFLGYHKSIVGNKLWRLDDVTSKVVLYRNMDFNESGEYKKTFFGSGVGTGSTQVLHRFEFEVKLLGDHTFEVEPQEIVKELVYKKYKRKI
uniref:Zinc finger, CCHC-type n=1 Tax=Tanacetum cinerariifolium TaxID=118510 RepID=A0A6L2M4N5_TANCI|nr:hypothetical protein [Tanacetum cinerariifolium]